MKITAIIIDDEPDARKSLQMMLKSYFPNDIEIMQSVGSVKEGVKAINRHNPELVFLDIEMPNESGFSLFEYFHEPEFEVIFTTAHQQYALEAIKIAALDYLLKPVNPDDLEGAIERFRKRNRNYSKLKIKTFISNLENDIEVNRKIMFPVQSGYKIEKVNNILFCKAEINYSQIHTVSGPKYMVATTLKNLEELLPNNIFFRTHKSYIINLNHVSGFERKDSTVTLSGNHKVDVAIRRTDELMERLSK
ncbi:MAG TPA: LytTR family DNA-binding domain-containing protein [Tenuifilaceae bacterium]|nr:LytTR family DNA-binding domain-containing protein [Tenuifilaceae bacterium]HPF93063.1 LytTR family DNA-binding domain-containing protein [Tenuifilaceae bacterium]HPQ35842.1 LytTR family DNA-binding domain-containing protein [Tenuifilaceae bacterium]